MKKNIHLSIDNEIWRAYKKFCANLEEHASNRVEKFMKRAIRRKKDKTQPQPQPQPQKESKR